MYTVDHSVAALRNADSVLSTNLLNDAEREELLKAIMRSIPERFCDDHAGTARAAIERKIGELHGRRETKGVEEQAEVAEGSDGPEQEAEGPTEGLEDGEDCPRFSRPSPKRRRRKAKASARAP